MAEPTTRISSDILQALILTKNEEPNLQRVLDKLQWLEKVVVLDSFSSDATLRIAESYPNVSIFQRAFDTHANQWNHGLDLLDSTWILSLDSDYVLTEAFIAETVQAVKNPAIAAYDARFEFLVLGRQLIANNTTARPVLFQKAACTYFDDGHTQRLRITGDTAQMKAKILHDDRKPLSRWLSNLDGYSIKEAHKLAANDAQFGGTSIITRIRKTKILAPFFVFFYTLFFKGLIFSGWAGWHYVLQRTLVEMLFALRLIEEEKLK